MHLFTIVYINCNVLQAHILTRIKNSTSTIPFQNRANYKQEIIILAIKHQDILSWWKIMQHHGIPTRLLDWPKSPYSAMFFALGNYNVDGAFYVLDAGYVQWIQSTRAKENHEDHGRRALNKSKIRLT